MDVLDQKMVLEEMTDRREELVLQGPREVTFPVTHDGWARGRTRTLDQGIHGLRKVSQTYV